MSDETVVYRCGVGRFDENTGETGPCNARPAVVSINGELQYSCSRAGCVAHEWRILGTDSWNKKAKAEEDVTAQAENIRQNMLILQRYADSVNNGTEENLPTAVRRALDNIRAARYALLEKRREHLAGPAVGVCLKCTIVQHYTR
jgi:hypothetical protein